MHRHLRLPIDYLAYLAVRVAACAVQAVSLEAYQAAAKWLAWLLWHVARVRRGVIDENLSIAFPRLSAPERQTLALRMWEHLLLMLAEIALAPRKIHRTNWREHSTFPAMAPLARPLISKRPVVLVSGHLGNFEMGGYLLGLHGFPTHAIARPLDNPFLDRWVSRLRGATGQFVLAKDGSGDAIKQVLDAGGTISLLGDQRAGISSLWVDFFGKPASTNKAVALLSLASGASTVCCAALRSGGPMHFELAVADVVDPSAPGFALGTTRLMAEWYTRQLEGLIRREPHQYWWLHRRWKGDPHSARAARRGVAAAAA